VRVSRTFGFVDLCGFTAYTESYGDSEAVDVLAEFRMTVRRVSSDHGVRVAKWLGDGAMFVGVDPAAVVATLLDVGRGWGGWPMAVRAGAATGHVILFEGDDYIGSAVNLASRLCDISEPGVLLVPADLPVDSDEVGRGTVLVPGFARPIDVAHYTLGGRPGELRLIADG
jgi:adenylate cyclase